MIGLASRGKSFGGLAGYLTLGSDRTSPERVAWLATRNLASDDPQVAAHIMKSTAALSKRVQKPVYHLIISWDEKDAPTPEAMTEIMDASLSRLGLARHQALYVAHDDTKHPHLHAMVNRVDEKTGKAWDGKKDRYTLRQILMEQECELGFAKTPARSQGRAPTRQELAIADRECRDEGRHMHKDDIKALRGHLRPVIEGTTSWSDLDGRLSRRGLEMKVAGNGVRIFRGGTYAKLSELLPPKTNSKKLHNRLGDLKAYISRKQQMLGVKLKRRRRKTRDRSLGAQIDE